MIDNTTVIIPAHNRPERLQRLLDYYRGTGIKIIIPDSSTDIFKGTYDDSQVTYIHLPGMHFLLKIREILPLIATPYVLYCADDDFAVPEGISECAAFLDRNPSYSIAQGHYLTFVPDRGRVRFYPRYIRNFDNRITGQNAATRLPRQKGMYASMLYGLTRTSIFKEIYGYCFDIDGSLRFRNLFLAEEFFNHSMLIHGEYATLPCFFSARERIPGSATTTTVPLDIVKNDPAYRQEFDGFIHALGLMLSHREGLTVDDAEQIIRQVSLSPADTAPITFKRRVNAFLGRHRWLGWASRLSDMRYNQKGLRAVKGMPSYPCDHPVPATDAIIRAVKGQ